MTRLLFKLFALANATLAFTLVKRGGPLSSTPTGTIDPSTWASDDTSATVIPEETSFPASVYFATTIGTAATVMPVASVAVATENPEFSSGSSAGETHKLGLAVALPVVLLFVGFLIGVLFLRRARARRAARHRQNNWIARVAQGWVPDSKEGPPAYTDEPSSAVDFHAANPMSPISPLPKTHQRKESIV